MEGHKVPKRAPRRVGGKGAPPPSATVKREYPVWRGPWGIPALRAGDGRRPVWLWLEDEEVHASLVPVDDTPPRRLSPADVARLLLADPSWAMPAIRALTGVADDEKALDCLRSWRQAGRIAANLNASDLSGRRFVEAMRKPDRSDPDGSIGTVSGGLPSINKRRR
ncbi:MULTISPECIES: hypothetical protein [Micromonospora]|uniref:hypothetical protein n=1 Tax=Micromonospora TaxID=1873 RepID=UPI001FFD9EDE|nr:hypothetical protein [Micromonospora sp. D75]